MSAEDIAAATPLGAAAVVPDATSGFAPAVKASERELHIGLVCALMLHALLLVGIVGFAAVSPEEMRRRLGDKSGADDGISVVLVDEADFRSRNTVPLDGVRGPVDTPPRPQPAPASRPQPPQPQEPEQKPQEEQQQTAATIAKEAPELLSIPELPGKPPTKRPAEKQEQKREEQRPETKQQAKANPFTSPSRPVESYPAFARPPGITRSGENDDFARGVIRALRQTMPPGRGSLGRVTIRFLLSDNGNLMEVKVVATSGDSGLTQNVVFASKQSSFPFPPKGATVADRTFLVTYIYE